MVALAGEAQRHGISFGQLSQFLLDLEQDRHDTAELLDLPPATALPQTATLAEDARVPELPGCRLRVLVHPVPDVHVEQRHLQAPLGQEGCSG